MSNHFHKAGELIKDYRPLSRWARSAHSSIVQWLNRRLKRRGPVAQDRPKWEQSRFGVRANACSMATGR
jgi:hypothetical protein